MDTVVCDEFLLDTANTGRTPCGAIVAMPQRHIDYHTFLEGWMAWLITAGKQAYKKDKDKSDTDAPPPAPPTPDPSKRY